MIRRKRSLKERVFNKRKGVNFSFRISKKAFSFIAIFLMVSLCFPTLKAFGMDKMSGTYDSDAATAVINNTFLLDEDGYIVKRVMPTENGDRNEMTDKLYYKVLPGESLSEVAYKFGLKSSTLIWINDISNPNRLRTGTKLIIPPIDGVEHTVKKGDNLTKIAKKYKAEEDRILKYNSLSNSNLKVGAKIFVPDGRVIAPPKPKYVARNYKASPRTSASYSSQPSVKSSKTPAAGKLLIWPTKGVLTQGYHRGHYALDIADRSRPPVFASASGTVTRSQCDRSGYGCYIVVDHGSSLRTLYGHCDQLYVKVGAVVKQGEAICKMGNTGRVFGPTGIHVHFEVIHNGVKRNPLLYF